MKYPILLTPQAKEMLKSIPDRRIQEKISEKIQALSLEPDKQGKPLRDDLKGCRSLRVVGQRYQIIYKVEKERVIVTVVSVGIRKEGDKKDIYTLTKKMIRLHLLN